MGSEESEHDGKYLESGNGFVDDTNDSDYLKKDKSSERSRSRSRSREKRVRQKSTDKGKKDKVSKDKERAGRDKDKKRKDRSRDRELRKSRERRRSKDKRPHDRRRERSRSNRRDRDRGRDHERHRRDRDHERRNSRDRDHERRNSRDRDHERRNSRDRDHERRNSRDRDHERRNSRDRGRSSRGRERDYKDRSERGGERREEPRREEPRREEPRETRFDLTQTIQELMNSTKSTQNFASLFNCTNSNDSFINGHGHSENSEDAAERKRKKKSRWGGTENDKTFIPGMPTILPSSLDPTQQEAYLVQLQIEEISRKLRTGDLGIPQNPEERSPSPEPIYSSDGKRLNTREFRFRKRLEEQRHQLIMRMQTVNPEFKPPADYKPPVTRVSDKVLIPQEEHPDINFVGLLIGPRGNTLKAMEKETGAKIIIRGKGSVKEGKVGRKDGQPLPGEDEPLHAFITAPNPEAVKKAVDKIKDVIRQGIEVPEGHNDLRRMQLRELAQLNGTLRETDCPRCTNCGSTEHKSWLCPDKPNVTNSIVCTSCGGAGHIAKDCRSKRPGAGITGAPPTEDSQAKIDEEYLSLMAELGEGPPPTMQVKPNSTIDPLAQAHLNRGYSLFDKKPTAPMQAIQAAPAPPGCGPNVPQSPTNATGAGMHVNAPPPPIPGPWIPPPATNGPWIPPPGTNGSMPPLLPPPQQPPPPPMMPWMAPSQPPPPGGCDAMQPPIPGANNLAPPPPPGTTNSPLPPLMPPPPGTTAPPLPPWSAAPPGFGGWAGGYLPPPPPGMAPPPPTMAPLPPGIGSLTQPPPPPPPA